MRKSGGRWLLGAFQLARFPLVLDRSLAQAQRKEGVVGRVGLQSGDARELFIIDGVANLVHSGTDIMTVSQNA